MYILMFLDVMFDIAPRVAQISMAAWEVSWNGMLRRRGGRPTHVKKTEETGWAGWVGKQDQRCFFNLK